jgi:hypothetical protein
MPDPTDALSDKALQASKLAHLTHKDEDHRAAGAAHTAAFQAAQANRPALASLHLQKAAEHDRHLDPAAPEGKSAAAHRATNLAKGGGSPQAHDAAAQAHRDAERAHREAGNSKQAFGHGEMAMEHEGAAARMRSRLQRPPGDGPIVDR